METQHTEHFQPTHHSNPIKAGFNKYLAIIVILAIIVTLLFYFKPLPHKIGASGNESTLPSVGITPEANLPAFTGNVTVWGLEMPGSLALGNPLSTLFKVNNTGNESIADVLFSVKFDDVVVYTSQVTDFAVNTTKTLGFTFMSTDIGYPKAGNHTLTIFADNEQVYSKDFEVAERVIAPDLQVQSFSTMPVMNVRVGNNVILTAYVKNVGLADSNNSVIRFYVNDSLLKEESAAIAQQITTPFKATWAPEEIGNYIVKVSAYALGDVHADDNEYRMNITVLNSTV